MLLTVLLVSSTALLPTEAPPLLNSPVFSLATLGADGRTSMNMLTYATPISVRPERLWAISIFRDTQTHANWRRRSTGVLQQLSAEQAPLTSALGGTSSAEEGVDTSTDCRTEGVWICSEGGRKHWRWRRAS